MKFAPSAQTLALLAFSAFAFAFTAQAQTPTINVQFSSGAAFTGAAVIGSAGDTWNKMSTTSGGPTALNNVSGAASGASVSWTSASLVTGFTPGFGATLYANLMDNYLATLGSNTITFTGLNTNYNYTLYVYTQGDSASAGRKLTVTPAIGTANTSTATVASASTFISGQNYMTVSATTNSSGTMVLTYTSAALEGDLNAIQIVPVGPVSVPATAPFPVAITLGNLTQTYTGSPLAPSVTTSPSGVAVTLTYFAGAGPVSAINAGTYTVDALSSNPANYVGVSSGVFVIQPASQTIAFTAPTAGSIGSPITLTATASSGLPVTFVLTSGNATLSANVVTPKDSNPITVTANQPGNGNYTPATSVAQTFSAKPAATQTISFTQPSAQTTASGPLALSATASSGLPITYTLIGGPATLNGSTLTFTGQPGVVTVQASQAGNAATNSATSTISFNVPSPNALVNLSTRGTVSAGQPLITGFIIGGTGSKPVVLRAVGPTLPTFGIAGVLAAPQLQLFDNRGNMLLSNAGWAGSSSLASAFISVGAFALPAASLDAAAQTTLAPGAYTLVVTGLNGSTGTVLGEVYDASPSPLLATQQLVNVSAMGQVSASTPLTAGFTLSGTVPEQILIRASGPALAALGVKGALATPQLSLFGSASTVIASNSNWGTPVAVSGSSLAPASASAISGAAARAGAFPFANGSSDAAILVTLAPGAYTAQVGGGSGVTLLEVYQAP